MAKQRVLEKRAIATPQFKALLKSLGEENLDQFQRRSLDYATKFSKIEAEEAENLLQELEKGGLLEDKEIAVQIVNCMPRTIEELRIFLAGGRRIVETSKLESILSLLNKYQKK